MGQAFGVPVVNGPMAPFCNLPKEALQSLWTSYNLLGEGWGLAWAEFKAIFKGAHYVMGMGFSEDQLMDLFNALDTDANGLVDALEMLITLALASGAFLLTRLMQLRQRLLFSTLRGFSSGPLSFLTDPTLSPPLNHRHGHCGQNLLCVCRLRLQQFVNSVWGRVHAHAAIDDQRPR